MAEQELRRSRRLRRPPEFEAERTEFDAVHRRFSDRVERFLMHLVIFGLVALVLVQTLAISPAFRRQVNLLAGTDGYALTQDSAWWRTITAPAGNSAAAVAPVASALTVTVVLVDKPSAPGAKLLVDGKVAGDFATKPSVTVHVAPGQGLWVDGSWYAAPLTFKVIGVRGVASPKPGTLVTTHGNRQPLGVVVKDDR